jgi:2-haloacid dehalogenase
VPYRPSVIVFDVNETLSDLAPMAERFTDVGAPAALAKQWFASVLRDGFALAATGSQERFVVIGEATLHTLLAGVPLDRDLDAAVGHILSGFGVLPLHPDVAGGVRALRAAGLRVVTLTNGSTAITESLLEQAGIRDEFELLLSVEDAGVWKPVPGAYEYAARRCDVAVGDMLLVAVHPWDIYGAGRAGMSTAWIDRAGSPYPTFFTPPTLTVRALTELSAALG